MTTALQNIEIPGIEPWHSGKVRENYLIDDERLLIVATDRISAFDWVFPNGIPGKGAALTKLSTWWFDFFQDKIETHFITSDINEFPKPFKNYPEILSGRSMLVKKTKPFAFEFIVRGYLDGSAWKEYSKSGTVWDKPLPENMQRYDKLPEVLFTPTTKAEDGHDEKISYEEFETGLGKEMAAQLRDLSIEIFNLAHDHLKPYDVTLLDTKFEFGMLGDKPILIDEVLTPDSSRFLLRDEQGNPQPFDKQYIRDAMIAIGWEGQTEAPQLPEEIVNEAKRRYEFIVKLISKPKLSKSLRENTHL